MFLWQASSSLCSETSFESVRHTDAHIQQRKQLFQALFICGCIFNGRHCNRTVISLSWNNFAWIHLRWKMFVSFRPRQILCVVWYFLYSNLLFLLRFCHWKFYFHLGIFILAVKLVIRFLLYALLLKIAKMAPIQSCLIHNKWRHVVYS